MAAASANTFDFRLYRYTPSLGIAAVAVVAFALLTSYHVYLIKRHRSLYFIAFTIGGLFQSLGYAGRIWSHYDTTAIGGFVIQAILILVAPALYAASIYMILARLIRAIDAQSLSLVPPSWLTRIFVTGDVVSFLMQSGGGGIQAAGTIDLYNIGEKLIIVGLFVQIAFFGFFVVTTITLHHRVASAPTPAASAQLVPWNRHIYVLYTTSSLILIRSIFRVIEYLQGNGGYLISHEVFLYVFDALLMIAVMVIFAVWYIGDLEEDRSKVREVLTPSSYLTANNEGHGNHQPVELRHLV